ncbi:MAG TPA: phosphoglucomutase/phosphomannomutase family protein [Terriglobia bacterium]|nr:phosphoglucomutase/phosphomannomutase family protein [Terriglobia bacterium]
MDTIKFGTDGWRGVIADDFTFANIERVAAAMAAYVKTEGEPERGLIVGYDTRFLSAEAADLVAQVVAGAGIQVTLADRPTPTPAVSYAVVARKAAGGIMVTASHNPYKWNGIKFKASYGGSAAPSIMRRIEEHLDQSEPGRTKRGISVDDLVTPYLARLRELVHLDRVASSGRRLVIDPMYGAGRGVIARLFQPAGVPFCEIHGEHNPLFPGLNPEPIEPHVKELRRVVTSGGYDAGLATDGDADRVGAIDRAGGFIDSHKIFCILLKHLVEDLGLGGEVVKTFSTTRMVDKMAAKYGLPVHLTPIGFKYICELMLTHDVLIGGEESGGIGIKGHLPERDGLLNSLLLAEVMADRGKTLGELVGELSAEFGPHEYGRIDLEVRHEAMARLLARVRHHTFKQVAGSLITSTESLDGFKMSFGDDAWLLVRPSGTENMLRLYAEAPTREQVNALLEEMSALAHDCEG